LLFGLDARCDQREVQRGGKVGDRLYSIGTVWIGGQTRDEHLSNLDTVESVRLPRESRHRLAAAVLVRVHSVLGGLHHEYLLQSALA
jgi:hypothetical protein